MSKELIERLLTWIKQIRCAAIGHGGMSQLSARLWKCKKCGKEVMI